MTRFNTNLKTLHDTAIAEQLSLLNLPPEPSWKFTFPTTMAGATCTRVSPIIRGGCSGAVAPLHGMQPELAGLAEDGGDPEAMESELDGFPLVLAAFLARTSAITSRLNHIDRLRCIEAHLVTEPVRHETKANELSG